MCSYPFTYQVSPNTYAGTGFMEHISRLKICYRDIAYTIKRKQKCSVLLLELWRNSISKDSIAMLFLHSPSNSRKQVQKYEEYFIRQKKYSHMSGKRCIFVIEKNVNICRKIECKRYNKE